MNLNINITNYMYLLKSSHSGTKSVGVNTEETNTLLDTGDYNSE